MSAQPGDAEFLALARRSGNESLTLVQVDLSGATLYFCNAEKPYTTPDEQTWEPGAQVEPLQSSLPFLTTSTEPVGAEFSIARRRMGTPLGATFDDYITGYAWQGATATIYHWERSVSAWAKALQVYKGIVNRVTLRVDRLSVFCLQDMSWDKPFPDETIDIITEPNAPNGTRGRPKPVIYGDHIAPPLRRPWAAAYTNKKYQEDAGGAQGVVPYIVTDPGTGLTGKARLLMAAHACNDIFDRASGFSAFVAANDVLAPLDTTGLAETLTGPSYLDLTLGSYIAYYGARPTDVNAVLNNAGDPARAMDPFDETTYATLDQAGGKTKLQLRLPQGTSLGYIEAVEVVLAFVGDAGNANNIRVYPYDNASATSGTAVTAVSTPTVPTILTGTWDANYWSRPWRISESAAKTGPIDLVVDFAAGATNKAHVLFAAVRIKYRPQLGLVTPAGIVAPNVPRQLIPQVDPYATRGPTFFIPIPGFHPAQFRTDDQFFGFARGWVDDGSGTYTGTASSLIKKPCDIARHLLVTYGGVAGADIEDGAGEFGSFVDARATLRDASPDDFNLACYFGENGSVREALRTIGEQSMCVPFVDELTNLWRFGVWRRGGVVDYDHRLLWDDIDFQSIETTTDLDLAQEVRVGYLYDYFRGRSLFETFVSPVGSTQGYNQPSVRDQTLIVEAGVNDDLDWQKGASVYADVLDPGTYTRPIVLAIDMQGKMRAHSTDMHVGYGFTIEAGFNDMLDFKVGASTYAAQMLPGEYTAEGLATEAARALSAASGSTFTGSYTHSSNSFTLSISSGTFEILVHLGANVLVSGWPALCINQAAVAAATQVGGRIYGDRFWASCERYGGATTFKFLWLTGASSATNCAELIGDTRLADTDNTVPPGAQGFWTPTYARGTRETTAAASRALYGPKTATRIEANFIRDEATAQRLRTRRFDLLSEPRWLVRFRTTKMPDLQRFRTFSFDADMDAHVPFPRSGSDGSWAGKVWLALEIVRNVGPSYFQEILAIEL